MSEKKERKTYTDDFKIAELNKLESYTAKEFQRLSEANGIDIQNLRNWAKSPNIGPKTRLGKLATKTRVKGNDTPPVTEKVTITSELLADLQKQLDDQKKDEVGFDLAIDGYNKIIALFTRMRDEKIQKRANLQNELRSKLGL